MNYEGLAPGWFETKKYNTHQGAPNNVIVELPIESWGKCKYRQHAGKRRTSLANGYCVECWDRGKGGGVPDNVTLYINKSRSKSK